MNYVIHLIGGLYIPGNLNLKLIAVKKKVTSKEVMLSKATKSIYMPMYIFRGKLYFKNLKLFLS